MPSSTRSRRTRNSPYLLDGFFGEIHRSAAGSIWRWRTEFTVSASLAGWIYWMIHAITMTWAIVVVTGTAGILALVPYIRRYERTIFVIKYGGAALVDDELEQAFAKDVTLLSKVGIQIVIVHGGGKEITETADRLGIATRFIDGIRYTDKPMMDVVQMVLAGKTNIRTFRQRLLGWFDSEQRRLPWRGQRDRGVRGG